jgi:ChrR Cupin-like domain
MHDPDSGMQTVLTEMAPGSVLPDHIHQAIEQSYVIHGKLVDHQSSATEGNFVWMPAGSRHTAHSPEGALILSFFIKPNLFVKSKRSHIRLEPTFSCNQGKRPSPEGFYSFFDFGLWFKFLLK